MGQKSEPSLQETAAEAPVFSSNCTPSFLSTESGSVD